MKKILVVVAGLLLSFTIGLQAQSYKSKNIAFRSKLEFPGLGLSNICGYASQGKEYALVGTTAGMSIVDVTNPTNPVKLFDIPGNTSLWREIKTWKGYAYVTTEGGGGITIVDLTKLPTSAPYKTYTGDGQITGALNTIHALHIDNEYAYIYGSNLGGAVILHIIDPWNPVYISKYDAGGYIHDGYVRNNKLYACHIYAGQMAVIDLTNKINPLELGRVSTPSTFTHNSWQLADTSSVVLTTDEVSNSYLASYDTKDQQNMRMLDKIRNYNWGKGSIVHNTHVINRYAVNSWYTDGVTIVDISNPDNLVEVGYFDNSQDFSGNGFHGAWGVYPFLPSGNLVVSDMEGSSTAQKGTLYVLTPTYVRAVKAIGIVEDSITKQPLNGVTIEVLNSNYIDSTNLTTNLKGQYKLGFPDKKTYQVTFSLQDYYDKTVSFDLNADAKTIARNIEMVPFGTSISKSELIKMIEWTDKGFNLVNGYKNDLTLNVYTFNGQLLQTKGYAKGETINWLSDWKSQVLLFEFISEGTLIGSQKKMY